KYVIVSSVDGDYQRVLESKLKKGEDVDIFVTEAIWSDLVHEYALPLNELGLKNSDLADYYRSSYQVSSDEYGRVLGLSPYTNNGVLIYRRSIAKDVLGTDDPTKVAAYVKNMKTFNNTAKKISDAGYTVTGAPDDLFRLYNSGNETPAVKNGKVTIPAAWKEWADYAKKTYVNDYYLTDNAWAEEWYGGMRDTGETFCYFGPSWFVDYTIGPNSGDGYDNDDQSDEWAVTTPPAGFVWGPVTLSIAGSSDNPHLAYDIIKTLSGDESIQKNLAIEELFMPNLKSVTKELAASDFSHNYLGGQNPYEIFHKAGLAVDINPENLWYTENLSPLYSTAMTDYIKGYITYEEALENFKEAVRNDYPELEF
ncbi:MAG: ABC transporter substrate-binding protein, partial [Ruminococcus sp.]|nr:ABC transporter substrate-binding protein [Ruminococcus sp.]